MHTDRNEQPFDPFACPRCNARLELIGGWREYGDQLVEIEGYGCWKCGYHELNEEDDPEDDEYTLY